MSVYHLFFPSHRDWLQGVRLQAVPNANDLVHCFWISVHMYDMRNHGQSAIGTLPYATWGKEEAKDVLAVVDFITDHDAYKDAEIGLLSIYMGQGATVAAFGMEDGLKQYKNIKCMISVQPMDYTCFVKAMGLPGFLVNSTTK